MADGSEARAAPTDRLPPAGSLADLRCLGSTNVANNYLAPHHLSRALQEHADREGRLASEHEAEAQRLDALAGAARLASNEHLKIAEAYATAAHHLRGSV